MRLLPSLTSWILVLGWLASLPNGKAQEPSSPQKVLIFDVTQVECGSCVYVVQQAIQETDGVTEVEVMQTREGYARVCYRPDQVTAHQIAQAVRETYQLHGAPYLMRLPLTIPAYHDEGTARKVDALFERWKKWILVKPVHRAKGIFVIEFQPLERDSASKGARGWDLEAFQRELTSRSPEGLGLEISIGQKEQE